MNRGGEGLSGCCPSHGKLSPGTKSSVGAEMNKLLDGALETLLDDRLVQLKREINQLAADNGRLRENIADWEMKRLAARAYDAS